MLRNTSGTVKAYFYVSSTFLPLVLRINCAEVYWSQNTTSNVYTIRSYSGNDFEVYCYHNTDGGGWTMFQHRLDGLVDFYWELDDSKKGFGPLNRDFWLGLDKIHRLTSQKRL